MDLGDRIEKHNGSVDCGHAEPVSSKPVRGRFDAVVEFNRVICREHFLLRLRVAQGLGATEAGQFVQLGCRQPDRGINEAAILGCDQQWDPTRPITFGQPEICGPVAWLRRPFSLAGRGDDEQGTWIDIIHRVVGVGTGWLARRQVGDRVDLIGPLGNRFTLPKGKSMALLVGGGVGLPPLFYLAQAMHQAGWECVGFIGATTADLLAVTHDPKHRADPEGSPTLSVSEFSRLGYRCVVTTDDGTLGIKGWVTTGLERFLESGLGYDAKRTVVYTCGPELMMRGAASLAKSFGIDCQVCLEQAMACGMGTCQSCVVAIEDRQHPQGKTALGRPWRYKLACTDGPIFDASQVVWEG